MVTAGPTSPRTLVTTSDFAQALHTAAHTARFSPSSHNCQPWALARMSSPDARAAAARLLNESGSSHPRSDSEYLAVVLDRDRQLDSLASHDLEMQLSCGAFTQMLVQTLAYQGWWLDRGVLADDPDAWSYRSVPAPIRALGVDRWRPGWSLLAVLELRYVGVPEGSLAEYEELVTARRTNRGPYREGAVSSLALEQLLTPSPGLAASAPVVVRHLRGTEERGRFVDFVARHAARDFSDRAAWRETHSYIRRGKAEAEQRGDGFTLSQLFGQLHPARALLMRTALHPTTMRLLKYVGYPRVLAGQLAAAVRPTPVIFAMGLTSPRPTAADVLRGGARLADYWLAATRQGLVLHPISVVLQHEDLRQRLQSTLGLPGRTFFVGRLGHPRTDALPAPRRPVATFTHTL